eukprot:scaffold1634_cov118-Skeletonema_dohrnii-CCMP3373.AAC.9
MILELASGLGLSRSMTRFWHGEMRLLMMLWRAIVRRVGFEIAWLLYLSGRNYATLPKLPPGFCLILDLLSDERVQSAKEQR